MLALSAARALAQKVNQKSRGQYKHQHEKKVTISTLREGEQELVQDETGRMRKLSQPWHGPYRIVSVNNSDINVKKIYGPDYSVI